MKEESVLVATRPAPRPTLSVGALKNVSDPGNGGGSHPGKRIEHEAITALALSLDNLYGCIELISEGRPAPLMRIMKELERDLISQAMIMAQANIRKAALLLGIKYTTLYAKIRKHGLIFSKAVRFDTEGPDLDL